MVANVTMMMLMLLGNWLGLDVTNVTNCALLETGADMVVQYQGARARRALGTRAATPAHPVNMLTDEQQSVVTLTQHPCSSAAVPRHCEVVSGVAQPHSSLF